MNLATAIAVIALAIIVFFVIRYLIREKRKGNKCIGCPYAGECQRYTDCGKQ
ncbi:MAG: FeoB-associated Cys-rich membrane protein [Firmicutes bacterium]|nr:FeoB-associated Cys-rich membrane protein [Bacillota bacterium]